MLAVEVPYKFWTIKARTIVFITNRYSNTKIFKTFLKLMNCYKNDINTY